MRSNYLTWVKNLDVTIEQRREEKLPCYDLSGSSVIRPAAFDHDFRRCTEPDLAARLGTLNVWGHPLLKEAIAAKYREYGTVDVDDRGDHCKVVITEAASLGIFIVCYALLRDGGVAAVEHPIYEPLKPDPRSMNVTVESFPRDPLDNRLDVEKVNGALSKLKECDPGGYAKQPLIVVSNLHNPTSAFIDDDSLDALAKVAVEHNAYVLVDEIFHDFVEHRQPPAPLYKFGTSNAQERFISVTSLSKVYGLSLLRCGWILAHNPIAARIKDAQVCVENNGSPLTQGIAAFVMENLKPYREHWVNLLRVNRDIVERAMHGKLSKFLEGTVPADGCIFFPEVKTEGLAVEVDRLVDRLKERGVFIVPGKYFGDSRRVRIGFGAATSEVALGLDLLADILEKP